MPKESKQDVRKPKRVKLSRKEILKRMADLRNREEAIIATVRKNKNRTVPA